MDNVRQMEAEAIAAEKAGEVERAIHLWTRILEAYPRWEHGVAHYNLANCYVAARKLDLAIEALRSAMALSPEDPMFSDALESLLRARASGLV